MAAKDELLAQHMDHTRQISHLDAAYQREGAAVLALSRPNDTVTPPEVITPRLGTPAGDETHELLVFSPASDHCAPI